MLRTVFSNTKAIDTSVWKDRRTDESRNWRSRLIEQKVTWNQRHRYESRTTILNNVEKY